MRAGINDAYPELKAAAFQSDQNTGKRAHAICIYCASSAIQI